MCTWTSIRPRSRGVSVGFLLLSLLTAGALTAPLPAEQTLYDATFGGGTFVAVGANGTIFSSVNGGPWELRVSPTTNRLSAIRYGGGAFVAAGENGTLITSSNGVNWTLRSVTATLDSPRIAYGNGRFVIGGNGPTGFWTMLVSSNATDWTAVNVEAGGAPHVATLPFGGVTYGAGQFLAVGGLQVANLVLTSSNGITWKELAADVYGAAKGPITYGNGQFAQVINYYFDDDDDDGGYADRLLISPDGTSWMWTSAPGATEWKAVAAADCTFVLATSFFDSSSVWFSHGGLQWNNFIPSPAISLINALAYGDGKFFAVGSDIVELNIPPPDPRFPISPDAVQAYSGASVYFGAGTPCLDPPVQYQWKHNGVNIPGATNTFLQLSLVTTNNAGEYTMLARNSSGLTATSMVATLTVTPAIPPTPRAPMLVNPTTDQTYSLVFGQDVYLGAYIDGWPTPSFQWRRNGINLPGATNSALGLFNVNESVPLGDYTLVGTNPYGSATSTVIRLTIAGSAPVAVIVPTSISAVESATVEFPYFPLNSYGAPQPAFYLFKDGAPLPLPLQSGTRLVLRDVRFPDAGEYTFVVSNSFGSSTGLLGTLTVLPGTSLDRWTQRNPLPQHNALLDVAHGNNRFVAVGLRGSVVVSSGEFWSAVPLRAVVQLSGVAFGNGLFVAVGEGNILTSTDGATWATRLTRSDLYLQAVGFGNGQFVAAGGDTILISTDGLSWTEASLSGVGARDFRDVAFGNGIFVAVSGPDFRFPPYDTSQATIWTSSNGTDWSPVSAGPAAELESVAFGNGQFVAVGENGVIYTSPNGTGWAARDSDVSSRLLGVTFGNGRFVVVGTRGRVLSSSSGVNWTKESSGTPDRLESIVFANGLFVAVGENGTIISSTTGSAWMKQSYGVTRDLDGIAVGDGLIVVAGKGGNILTSSNGVDFTPRPTGITNDLHGVAWADGLYVAVGEPEIILTSSNAVQWTLRHSGTISSLKDAHWSAGIWIAVGTEGAILTSANGTTWTRRQSPSCHDLNDVTYGNGLFVIVGDSLPPNGTLLTSTDGIAWTRRNQYIGKNVRSVTFANNTFFATANDGIILVSSNGMDWDSRLIQISRPLYGNYVNNLRAATYAAGTWIVVGNLGLILTSADTFNWEVRFSPVVENLHGVVRFGRRFVVIGNRGGIIQSDYTLSPATLTGRFASAGFELDITGDVGVSYRLEGATDLAARNWTTLRAFTLSQPSTNITDTSASTFSSRFYRVVSP